MSNSVKWAILAAITLWASAFVGIRAGLHGYSPEGLALLRYLIASTILGLVYWRLPARNPMNWPDRLMLLFTGVLGIGVYNLTLNYGEIGIPSGIASFITSQSPIITTAIAVMLLGERLNASRVLGFFVSLLGVAFIAKGQFGGFHWNVSMTYIVLATVSGSFYTIMQKPYLKKYHAIQATTYVMWGGTLFLLFYLPKLGHDLHTASLSSTLTVAYLGVFPAALGYLAWSYALAYIPASRAVSFIYFMPLLATGLGWLCLGEVPTLVALFGGLLTIVGVFIINRSYTQLPRHSVQPER